MAEIHCTLEPLVNLSLWYYHNMHPLLGSLEKMSDNELEQKLSDVNKRYWQTSNFEVREQIIMVIDAYKLELESRRIKQRIESQQNGNSGLDNLINIS